MTSVGCHLPFAICQREPARIRPPVTAAEAAPRSDRDVRGAAFRVADHRGEAITGAVPVGCLHSIEVRDARMSRASSRDIWRFPHGAPSFEVIVRASERLLVSRRPQRRRAENVSMPVTDPPRSTSRSAPRCRQRRLFLFQTRPGRINLDPFGGPSFSWGQQVEQEPFSTKGRGR